MNNISSCKSWQLLILNRKYILSKNNLPKEWHQTMYKWQNTGKYLWIHGLNIQLLTCWLPFDPTSGHSAFFRWGHTAHKWTTHLIYSCSVFCGYNLWLLCSCCGFLKFHANLQKKFWNPLHRLSMNISIVVDDWIWSKSVLPRFGMLKISCLKQGWQGK